MAKLHETLQQNIKSRNARTLENQSPGWLRNCRLNASYINREMLNRPLDLTAYQFPPNKDLSKAVIIGSGPSLRHMKRDHLLSLNQYLIVATPTNISWAFSVGLIPDILVVADSHSDHVKDLASLTPLLDEHNVTLLTSPITHPEVLHVCHPRIYFYKAFMQQNDGTLHLPYNHFLNLLYDNLQTYIVQAGSVTNQAVLLMEKFRHEKLIPLSHIYLLGCDYCLDEPHDRIPIYIYDDETASFYERPSARPNPFNKPQELIKHGPYITNVSMLMYKISLMVMWKSMSLPLFRIGRYGMLDEIPHTSIRSLAHNRHPDMYPEAIMNKALNKFWNSPEPEPVQPSPPVAADPTTTGTADAQ